MPRRKITVCSIGWSDVPDYAEQLLGFVFDLEQVGRDADSKAKRWEAFGGCNEPLDRELQEMWPLPEYYACLLYTSDAADE